MRRQPGGIAAIVRRQRPTTPVNRRNFAGLSHFYDEAVTPTAAIHFTIGDPIHSTIGDRIRRSRSSAVS